VVDAYGQADDSAPLDVAGDILSTLSASNPEPVAAPEAPVEQAPQADVQQDAPQQGDHPAWGVFKDKLGEALYYSIQPDLAKMSEEYHQHVTKVNAQLDSYKPFQPFVEAQVDPEFLQQSITMAQAFNNDPVAFYGQITEYLKANGSLPENPTPKQVQNAIEDEFGDGAVNQPDPEVAALKQQVESMQAMFSQAAQQQQLAVETQKLETQFQAEIDALPDVIKNDNTALQLVVQQAQAQLATSGRVPKLSEIAATLLSYREGILKTPRPNDSAPRLPGSGGGIPTGTKPIDEYTKEDDIDFIAALVKGGQQR
jgi:hypothetical protein